MNDNLRIDGDSCVSDLSLTMGPALRTWAARSLASTFGIAQACPRKEHSPRRTPRVLLALFLLLFGPGAPSGAFAVDPFTALTISQDDAPWGKNLADVNGDGKLDILEGGGCLNGVVLWREYPTWIAHTIATVGGGDDLQIGDINGDGALDVVVNGGQILWYANPRGQGGDPTAPWTRHVIEPDLASHDLTVADVNLDGKPDVLIRVNFGLTNLYIQNSPDSWTKVPLIAADDGIGSTVADIDRDGRPDVVENGYWLRQPPDPIHGSWIRFEIGPWPAGSSVCTGDVNGDGRRDVSLAVSESGIGGLAWFEAPADPKTMTWTRHDIGTVQDVHRHHLVDVNQDGSLDLVFAEMHQSSTRRVGIYYNGGAGAGWTLQTLSTGGSHNIAVGDVEGDGDPDIVGANWDLSAPDGGDVILWRDDRIRGVPTGVDPEGAPTAPRAALSVTGSNPFRTGTDLEFSVTRPGRVTLRVFDLQGRMIATLFDGIAETGRSYRNPFSAGRLATGVYFAQLEFAGAVQTRRVTVLR